MIITVANQKGGSGKSTIVQNLSIMLGEEHGFENILVIDTDPQKSIEMFCNLRSDNDKPSLTCINRAGKSLKECIRAMIDKYEIIIIDTAGSENTETQQALLLSNICLIPTTNSQYDLSILLKTMEDIQKLQDGFNPYLKSFILLNKIPTNPFMSNEKKDVITFINSYKEENKIDITLLDSAIYERISYKRCVSEGFGVSELESDNKARLDFKKFYDELFNILEVK